MLGRMKIGDTFTYQRRREQLEKRRLCNLYEGNFEKMIEKLEKSERWFVRSVDHDFKEIEVYSRRLEDTLLIVITDNYQVRIY